MAKFRTWRRNSKLQESRRLLQSKETLLETETQKHRQTKATLEARVRHVEDKLQRERDARHSWQEKCNRLENSVPRTMKALKQIIDVALPMLTKDLL
jgi:predicted  nucleic acid-binding Zn-ribbon protein